MAATSAANGSGPDGDSLAARLRACDDEYLMTLLRLRPDLATPPPADSSVLATRAGVRSSVARACEDLDSFSLTVLEGLVLLGADEDAVALNRLAGFIGPDVTEQRVARTLARLRERALVWGEDSELHIAPATRETTRAYPGGLGAAATDLTDERARRILDELDDEERQVVAKLAEGPPAGRTKDAGQRVPLQQAENPIQRLLARGWLLRRDSNTVELPRQLGLAMRGDAPMGAVETEEPVPELDEHGTDPIDATAAGEILELSRHIELLLDTWGQEPPDVLRSGGVGVRDLRRTAKALDIDEQRTGLLVELVVGAGLVDSSTEEEPQWVPTVQADTWLAAPPEQRWVQIAAGWLRLPRLPGRIGGRDDRDRLLGPLSEGLQRSSAPAERRRVLELLDEHPSGHGVRRDSDVAAVLAWRAPRRGGALRDELVSWTLAEARTLGVVALGGLSAPGRALLAGDEQSAANLMGRALPEPVDHVLVQADLTVVAPGRLQPELAGEMALVADVESAGSATVYRVGESSVRRALDAGRSAEDLHALFRDRSRTPVPQALTYLIDDVARRHGKLRAGTASAFLRCDDPVLITEVLAKQELRDLSLRRIAPTVLISPLPMEDVLGELRTAGFPAVAEGPEGGVLDLRPGARRIRGRATSGTQRRDPSGPTPPSEQQLLERVRAVRAGDQAAAVSSDDRISPERGRPNASATVAMLEDAARLGNQVWLGFVDKHGGATQRIVQPVSVGGGVLQAFDSGRGESGAFPLHRITSVAVIGRPEQPSDGSA